LLLRTFGPQQLSGLSSKNGDVVDIADIDREDLQVAFID